MIRKNIIKNKNDKQRYFLNDSWRIEMPAVVRTPFYGNNCSEYTRPCSCSLPTRWHTAGGLL